MGLLYALESHGMAKRFDRPKAFTFQHKLCPNFESLIWVIVYATIGHQVKRGPSPRQDEGRLNLPNVDEYVDRASSYV